MPYNTDMRKTSVYLTDEEAEALRRAAEVSGRSQAELLREGVRYVVGAAGIRRRTFRSMGTGHGGGASYAPPNPDELYAHVMGRRRDADR
jgi:hypothetical protein